jgi:hypothetical protein
MITFASTNKYEMITTDDSFLNQAQEETIRSIVEGPDFDFTCLNQTLVSRYKNRGIRTFHYYTKDGNLHGIRVGLTGRILAHVEAFPDTLETFQRIPQ